MTRYLLLPLIVLGLCATAALGAESGVTFETITLSHLTACEIAPLLGPQFRFAGEATRPALREDLREFPGVSLIVAADPRSSYLLVAGTPEGVGALRGFIAPFDGPRPTVRITATVYPAPPSETTGWTRLGEEGGIQVLSRVISLGAKLAFPPLPPDFKPTVIEVSEAAGATEFVPLPAFGNFPQVVVGVAADVEKGRMRLGVGVLSEQSSPLGTAEAAANLRYTLSMQPGESIALLLMQDRAAVTVVVEAGQGS